MSTFGQLIDRAYREFLTPADEQPTRFTLAAEMAVGATTFTVNTAFLSPEEESLFGPGTVVEFVRELVQIGAYDDSTNIASACKREILGTDDAGIAHPSGSYGVIAPEYPRQTVFDALADAIVGLYPDLYAVTETASLSFSSTTYTEVAATVMEPMYVWARATGATQYAKFTGIEFLDNFPPSTTDKAIVVPTLGQGATGYLVHKAKFARPTLEADNLVTTIGLQAEWEQVALVTGVAHLISGKDLSQRQQEFITQQLASTGYPVLTPTRIRQSLLSYAEYLMDRAQRGLRARQPATVTRHSEI